MHSSPLPMMQSNMLLQLTMIIDRCSNAVPCKQCCHQIPLLSLADRPLLLAKLAQAALDCLDTISHHVQVQVARGGSLQVTQGASGDQKPHAFGWRDAMDVLVKWRQLSEPNDQVHIPKHLELQMVVQCCHLPLCAIPLLPLCRTWVLR